MVRKRHPVVPEAEAASVAAAPPSSAASTSTSGDDMPASTTAVSTQWVFYAVASGACAAFNGVFAKLTTTELTGSLSNKIADTFGLSDFENIVEVAVRALFFGLNLTFNGVMWTLFTKALARGTSTTQVSIMNTSTNFMITALLGFVIFSESLPPLWWAGAALLVAGNVVVGRKDEGKDAEATEGGYEPVPSGDEGQLRRGDASEDEDVIDLGDNERTRYSDRE
ncbi:hypothetical protein B0J13DRAFT_617047 [Dactylonectria estremocensis]|uniref:EamA domain-containing protein n=1 Tax=Dactylonectria estremocensis TaxID=1079267 RepID=A0A9P9JCG4_9HYPO|nr:hypothetical protein B0J13DRAFT_617047 [Dactylonectria estremocensis]